ncbi:MAG: SIMPL domain-containing protein [Acidobacteria bacterium]|nr:SIMPL domain-containing protein [Acidobacteriota bacterium]
MRNVLRLAPLFLAAAALACAASCSEQKKEPLRTRLLVTGESDSKVPPDTAVIVLSVVTQGTRALDAQQQNARKSDAVIQAVKQAAGASPEVQTSDYSLEPQRDWWGGLPRIKGYEARNSVTVTTNALDAVGAVLDAATQAGANSVESVRFILREAKEARGRALGEAGQQAMAKAEAMAQAMGGRIVRVVEEREGNFPAPPPQPGAYDYLASSSASNMNADMSAYAAKAAPRTPVESGSLQVRSQVYLVVEVEAQPR